MASPFILIPSKNCSKLLHATAGVNKAVELIFKTFPTHLKYLVNKIWLLLAMLVYEHGQDTNQSKNLGVSLHCSTNFSCNKRFLEQQICTDCCYYFTAEESYNFKYCSLQTEKTRRTTHTWFKLIAILHMVFRAQPKQNVDGSQAVSCS